MISSKVKLVSSEGEEFEVDICVATASTLIRNMIEDVGSEDPIPLPNVRSDVLRKVIEYCKHHVNNPAKEIPKPLRSNSLTHIVSPWDEEFVNIEQELLFELMLTANYMDIKPLLDLVCAKVATMIKGKKAEEIRQIFNIQNDFTPEEEAAVREENKWCEEP
ncbi:putative suppressor of kinetochore protein 1 [Cryptosporidium serpentis]|uniref:Suppressor of kinetochore protein 1, putative n=2 Tax=Cryptosporidium TaxID=5806 RepID=B6AFT1_CRYMR|nr:suppressor of kinetochore protein 1, putative [Cryptosporidium muris RN66]EEA07072.1 suppressor of kinetochore protein 1, putative [Cryptosporidium muris RN66]OII75634.1 suppressor of kinetochore protein 1 [Cryptosporidium andersoni]|eukprot:XP_002141421.1 suppressor of kinetochore protein 1 [Cryptosporidium muris RN66]